MSEAESSGKWEKTDEALLGRSGSTKYEERGARWAARFTFCYRYHVGSPPLVNSLIELLIVWCFASQRGTPIGDWCEGVHLGITCIILRSNSSVGLLEQRVEDFTRVHILPHPQGPRPS